VSRSLLAVIHNPRNRTCGCDPDCWCNRTAVGRAVKWWFNGRLFGLQHKSTFGDMTPDERREWKRKQSQSQGGSLGISPMVAQPKYEKVRLGPAGGVSPFACPTVVLASMKSSAALGSIRASRSTAIVTRLLRRTHLVAVRAEDAAVAG